MICCATPRALRQVECRTTDSEPLHPAEEAKLHTEIKPVLGGRPPQHQDLAKLTYTRMVIEEAMRLYPPAHTISRTPRADDELCNKRILRGSVVLISPWVLHRHRQLWERPDVFDPERFAPERAAARPRFSYLPFGAGPRICIGAAFAMAEAMLILATIAQRYSLRLARTSGADHAARTLRAEDDDQAERLNTDRRGQDVLRMNEVPQPLAPTTYGPSDRALEPGLPRG
jgi:cytochrome P450